MAYSEFKQTTYSVSSLSAYIKGMFNRDDILSHVYVKGEVSNCKYHQTGHIYFTLKDNNAQISCVMFAGSRRTGISFDLKDGQSVIVYGYVSVYEKTGTYQIYAQNITLDGAGRLYAELEILKKKLSAEGLFDASKKKKIPKYAMTIGIVTASTGAAIHDICTVAGRRNKYVRLILYPAQVQGAGAAETIVKGIKCLDGKVDTIIIGRGGGSIEDLWPFNEEIVVRAVYECNTPIISAVGHETDFLLSDMAADLRAATPSAAAELAVFCLSDFEENMALIHERLYEAFYKRIDSLKLRLSNAELKLKKNSPASKLELKKQILKEREKRLKTAMDKYVYDKKNDVQKIGDRLKNAFYNLFERKKNNLKLSASRLVLLNPAAKLKSGFSYVADKKGKNVTSIKQVNSGDLLTIYVTDGSITAIVTEAKENNGKN